MGYVITCVGAIINGWLIYLFVTYIDPAVFSDYITNALDVLTQGRKSQTSYLSDKEFLEAGKKQLEGDLTREASTDEVSELRKENARL